ncbi:MAG: hypothetical protein ACXAD7_15430 [Candidatus Kariarchaeaceae archaeon]|jgi:5-methyltetrahydropteroyltriglutamate--homocysteine methyltransferase
MTTDINFLSHEVGSLRKPNVFIKAARNEQITEKDFNEFGDFCQLIGLEQSPADLVDLLKESGPKQAQNPDYHQSLARWRVRLNIKYKESSGIDLIDAGEWVRREMYQHIVDNDVVSGISMLDHVRSFDYNFYKPGIYSSDITYNDLRDIHLQEYKWAFEDATKPLKVCITAFNTVAEWSYQGKSNFDDLMFELIDEIFVPETIKLLKAGVNWIQMDEPALTTHPKHVPSFVDGWNYWVDKIKPFTSSDTVLSLHNCFSDYNLLWPILPELDDLGALTLEFANRDTWNLGAEKSNRKAYSEVRAQIEALYKGEIGFKVKAALGVLPVHTDHETSPELIRDRLLYVNEIIEDPKLVLGAPDCGLRQRSLPIAHKLLQNLAKGSELARNSL